MSHIVAFEGSMLTCEAIERDWDTMGYKNLKPGDTYIGRRNTNWKMGTVSARLWDKSCEMGYIYGEVNGNTVGIYPFDFNECLKVLAIDGDGTDASENL